MSTLVIEAERRFLGAVLADPRIEQRDHINASDFSNPAYSAVYAALDYVSANTYLEGPELSAQVAKYANVPGIDQPVLELMRAEAPTNSDHVTSYAGMISEASFMRQLQDIARKSLHTEAEPSPEDERESQVTSRFSKAGLDFLELPYTPEPSAGIAPGSGSRTWNEEQLVASILANPDQVRTVVEIAPPETLEDFRCRTVYELVASMGWNRDAATDLDLLYQLGKAEKLLVNSGHEQPEYAEPDAAYLKRMRETPTYEHTGTDAARAIAAQDSQIKVEHTSTASLFANELAPDATTNISPATPGTQTSNEPQPGLGGGLR